MTGVCGCSLDGEVAYAARCKAETSAVFIWEAVEADTRRLVHVAASFVCLFIQTEGTGV